MKMLAVVGTACLIVGFLMLMVGDFRWGAFLAIGLLLVIVGMMDA